MPLVAALVATPISPVYAHTISIGYENSGDSDLTFWYGAYDHGTSYYNEGSLRLQGPDGFDTTLLFDLLTRDRPGGLDDGETNFYSGGSASTLVDYNSYGSPVVMWQGREFLDLFPGTYTFTYIEAPTPTALWDGINNAIHSSSVTVITADLNVSAPRVGLGDVVDEHSAQDPLIFEGGTLRTVGDAVMSQVVSVTGDGADIDTSGNYLSLTGDIDGRGEIVKSGEGILSIDGRNTNTGGFALTGGTLRIDEDADLGAPEGGLRFDGGTLQLANSFDLDGRRAINLDTGGGTIDTWGHDTTVSQAITGSGALTKTGTGSLTLVGANAYTGETNVLDGTLALSGSGSVESSSRMTVAAPGTFDISGTTTGTAVQTLAGNGSVALGERSLVVTDGSSDFGGVISGSGGFTVAGGTQSLSGANTYSGATNVTGGILALQGDGNIADSSRVTVDGILDVSGTDDGTELQSLAGSGSVVLGDRTLTVTSAGSDFGGVISGTGGVTVSGGMQTLSGENTFIGETRVNGGTLALTGAGSLARSSRTVVDGTLDLSASDDGAEIKSLDGAGTVALGDRTLTLTEADDTFAGAITGTGGVALASGTQTLAGSNTFSGGLVIEHAAKVVATADENLGTGAVTIAGGTLAAGGDLATDNAVTITSAASTLDTGAHVLTLAGAVTGDGSLNKQGTGTLILSADNDYNGETTIGAGTLALRGAGSIADSSRTTVAGTLDVAGTDHGAELRSLAGAGQVVLGDRDLTLTNGADTFGGVLAGDGGLTVSGGRQVLSGTNTYTGETRIAGGILALSGKGSLSSSSRVAADGTLDVSGADGDVAIESLAGAGSVVLGSRTLTLTDAADEFAGDIAGSGGVNIAAGIQTLSGTNTFAGGLYVDNDAVVRAAAAESLGTGTVTLAGGTLRADAGFVSGNAFAATGSGAALDTGEHQVELTGPMSGSGGLTKLGNGTLTLSGDNGYLGETRVSAGTLALTGAGTIADSSSVTVHGALDISGANDGASLRSLAGTGSVELGDNSLTLTDAAAVFAGNIGGRGKVAVTGGKQALSGNNTFDGGLVIDGGATVAVSADRNLGRGTVTMGNGILQADDSFTSDNNVVLTDGNATVDTSANHVTVLGNVSGPGTLNKSGTGTLTLTGSNSQNGINLVGGILEFDSDEALGRADGVVTINEDTTLRTLADMTITRQLLVNDTRSAAFDTGGHEVTVAGDIDGAGVVQKMGEGTLILSGRNSHVRMDVREGALQVASQESVGAVGGDIYLNENGRFSTGSDMTVSQNVHVVGGNARFDTGGYDVVLTGSTRGEECLIKSGQGRLDMRADGSNAVGACVEEGLLSFNSTFAGDVWVLEDGTAGGAGRIAGDMEVTGRLSPGNSPGRLVVAGSVTQMADSTLEIEVDGPTAGNGAGYHDQLALVGHDSVYTADGTLALQLRDIGGDATNAFTPTIGDAFTIVEAEGGVAGSFEAVKQPAAGLPVNARFDVVYRDDHILTVVTPESFGRFLADQGSDNATALGAAVDRVRTSAGTRGTSPWAQLQEQLVGVAPEQLGRAFQQAAGEVHADAVDLAARANGAARSTVRHRLHARLGNGESVSAGTSDALSADGLALQGVWGLASHSEGHVDGDDAARRYSTWQESLTVGADADLGDDALIGIGAGYTRSDLDAGWLGDGEVETWQALVYGSSKMTDGVYVQGILGAGYQDHVMRRKVDLRSARHTLESDTSGTFFGLDVEAGRRLEFDGLTVIPAAGFTYDWTEREAFTETGDSSVALTVSGEHRDMARGRAGIRLESSLEPSGNAYFKPYLSLFGARDLTDSAAAVRPSLDGLRYQVKAADPGRNALEVGVGAAWGISDRLEVVADYEAEARRDGFSYAVKAGLQYRF